MVFTGASNSDSILTTISDLFLSNLINILPSSKYTVVYTTRPLADHPSPIAAETSTYEMDRTNSPFSHIELKRYASIEEQASPDNDTLPKGPLFERYQFFTPGAIQTLSYLKCSFIAYGEQVFSWVSLYPRF